MRVEILNYVDHWQEVKNAAMNTVGKEDGKYPDSKWKRRMLLAEHSPVRLVELTIRMHDLPYWISVHLVRHHVGVEHFVSTQRSDRTGVNRATLPQNAPVCHTMHLNAQAMIYISRKRLCRQAAKETRQAWLQVVEAVRQVEPELASVCVPECVYRGFCPELKPCGYARSVEFIGPYQRYIDSDRDVSTETGTA